MIFFLAALQNMSPELREDALQEGAGRWTTFRRVVFPLLMPTTLFVLINAVLNAFKLVDHLFILTKGGPDNASNLLLYYIYENAFSFFDPNYASTLTVIMLLLYSGNNFLWPLVVTNSVETRPLTVGLAIFGAPESGVDWSVLSAGNLLATAPLLIAFLLFQRQFMQSFLYAGVK